MQILRHSCDGCGYGSGFVCILGNGTGSYSFRDLLGKEGGDVIDPIAASTIDTITMPRSIGYDGKNLWVSEFKFANRILRFAKWNGISVFLSVKQRA